MDVLDLSHLRHERSASLGGMDHLLRAAILLTISPDLPETSVSFPVRRIILSDPLADAIRSTMHPKHSAEPGSGAYPHPAQSMTRASPSYRGASGLFFSVIPAIIPFRSNLMT